MAIALAVVLVDAADNDELGAIQTLGALAATVALPIVVAVAGHALLRHLRGEDGVPWWTLTPEAIGVAGLLAFYIALFAGVPETERVGPSASTASPPSSPSGAATTEVDCDGKPPNPAEKIAGVEPVRGREARLTPGAAEAFTEFPGEIGQYRLGGIGEETFIATLPVGGLEDLHVAVEDRWTQYYIDYGWKAFPVKLSGVKVTGVGNDPSDPDVLLAHSSCYVASVWGNSPELRKKTARQLASS
jgi:hypothetical protein